MNLIINVLLCFICNYVFTQITITSSNLPGVGDTIHYKISTLLGFNENNTGENVIWDFSDLSPFAERADTIISVQQTPVVYNVIFNPLIANQAYINQTPPSMGIGITVEDYYDFFYKKNSFYRKAGFGAKINGVPTPVKYDNPELFFKLPLTYGTTDSSVSHYSLNIPGYGYFGQTIKRKHIADGWGQVITPFGTFNALRVKSIINYIDTFYYEQYSFGTTIVRPTEYEYYWLTNQFRGFAVKVYKLGLSDRVDYYFEPQTKLSNLYIDDKMFFYYNDFDLIIESKLNKYTVIATDITGKIILCKTYRNCYYNKIDISSWQSGLYILSIAADNDIFTKMISKTKKTN